MAPAKDINEYISAFPEETQQKMQEIRAIIRKAAPDAEELISYAMPAFKQHSVLVYFAAYKNHIGFYPTSSGIEAFKDRLNDFKWSKGAVQFPLSQALPVDLISEMVLFRLEYCKPKAAKKTKK
ncbi:MAG: iron chaperone [Saprospiraceae bacterium]